MVESKFVLHNIQMSLNFATLRSCIFISFQQITLKLGSFLLILWCSFQWCQRIFPDWPMSKVEETMEGYIRGHKNKGIIIKT